MERFWRPALINSVLPVVLVFCLAVFVFFTGGQQLCVCLVCPAAGGLKPVAADYRSDATRRHMLTCADRCCHRWAPAEPTELATRLEMIVALFLALTGRLWTPG